MSEFQKFSADDAEQFATRHSALFGEHSKLQTQLLSDRHLNQLFRVKNQHGTSLIVKQALPYVRWFGEHYPLTLDRAQVEASILQQQYRLVPDHSVEVIYFDPLQAVLLLEDLGDHQLLGTALRQGKSFEHLAEHMATYLAHTGFYNSDFALDGPTKRQRMVQFSNPQLCQITEDLCFTDPFCHHERNDFSRDLLPLAQQLWFDESLKAEVAGLKNKFLSRAQTLIHGSLHSSSVFVTSDSSKVFDADFGCYGPMGFDLGTLIGSLLLHYVAAPGLIDNIERRQQHRTYLKAQISVLCTQFQHIFLKLAQKECRDQALQNEIFLKHFVQQVLCDAFGYAGCEMIRRTLGMAHQDDFAHIQTDQTKLACETNAIELGRRLILQHRNMTDVAMLMNVLELLPD